MVLIGTGLDRKRQLHDAEIELNSLGNDVAVIGQENSGAESLAVKTVKRNIRKALKRKCMVYRVNQSSAILVFVVNVLVGFFIAAVVLPADIGIANKDSELYLIITAVVVTFAGIFLSKVMRGWVELQEGKIDKQLLMLRAEMRTAK